MGFVIRNAKSTDINDIYSLVKEYYDEIPNRNDTPFGITPQKILEDAFSDKSRVFFIVAEFEGNILGYCAYFYAYDAFQGDSIIIEEIFVSKDYRGLGVALFLFSKLVDVAIEIDVNIIRWAIDITVKTFVLLAEKVNVDIDYNLLVLNIYKEDIRKHLKLIKKTHYTTRLARVLDLPDIFELIKDCSLELQGELTIDLYKLMADGFALHPKFNIFVTLENDMIIGFLFFYEAYSTFNGKSLIINKTYIDKAYRLKDVKDLLYNKLYKYAYLEGYERIETSIDQQDFDKLNYLVKKNIKPLEHYRIASFKKADYTQLLNFK
jgi:GNAT superfamily N-acetyltransferase